MAEKQKALVQNTEVGCLASPQRPDQIACICTVALLQYLLLHSWLLLY